MFEWFKKRFRRGQPTQAAPAAALAEIRQSFELSANDEEHFPSTIDPRIYHVQFITRHFGNFAGQRILDAGCGKGRFARVLLEQCPTAEITGMDLALAMLHHVQPPLLPCCATLTRYPFRDQSFDAVYATESLEHAVDIEAAIAELCRVLKPGGKLVIIDKNIDHWGRFKTPSWERWFGQEELETMLQKHCRQVSSEFISYWEDVAPDGLFIGWKAVK